MIEKAKELKLSLFYIRWEGATFVDIAQSIGELILETEVDNKRTGDYLYNLLFGYEVFTLSALGYADYTKYRLLNLFLFVSQICGYLRFGTIAM